MASTIVKTRKLSRPNFLARKYRKLWDAHVVLRDGADWKGPVFAYVPKELASDVAAAMGWFGALLDGRDANETHVLLRSNGYRAHGF